VARMSLFILLFQSCLQLRQFPFDHIVSMLGFRELSFSPILCVSLQCLQCLFSQVRILLYKFCSEGLEDSEDIANDHHLPIRVNSSSDTVDKNGKVISNDFTNFRWDRFYEKGESPRFLNGPGIFNQFQRCLSCSALGFDSTPCTQTLRGKTDVTHD